MTQLPSPAGIQVDSDFVSATICQKLYQCGNYRYGEEDFEGIVMAIERIKSSLHVFITGLVELLPTNTTRDGGEYEQRLKNVAKIQVEVDMLDFDMARRYLSSIAFVVLLSSMNAIGADASCPLEDGLACMQNIALVMDMNANDAKYRELRDELAGMVQQ